MNRNTLFKLGALLLLTMALSASALAQIYVSATNGDDTFGNGSSSAPYRTIQKAINVATTGSTINVEAGVYNSTVLPGEGNPITLNVVKTLTFVGTAVGTNTTVELTNGFTLNHASAVVDFGSTGSAKFNFGSSATALVLTAGSMTSAQPANVVIGNGATITFTAGTLNFVPTTGANLNVVFDGTTVISSTAGFLPSSLGTGTLTINKASGAITIDNSSLSLGNLVHSGAANVTITGNLTVAANGDITNSNTGTLTIGSSSANTLTMSTVEGGAGVITVSGGGSVVVNSKITYNVKNAATSSTSGNGNTVSAGNIVALTGGSNFTANGDITFNNTNVVTTLSGTAQNAIPHNVTLSNGGTGTLAIVGVISTPLSSATFASGVTNNAYVSVILSNTSTGSFSVRTAATRGVETVDGVINNGGGTMTLGQSGDTFSTTYRVVNDGATAVLTINAAGTFSSTDALAFRNLNAASQVVFGANSTIAGQVTNAGLMKLNTFTITLSKASATALDNTGNIYSVTSGVTGSGTVKLTGSSGVITGTGNLPNVELANSGTVTTAGNTIWGSLLISGSGTYTIGASAVKGDLTITGSGNVTFNGTSVTGAVNVNGGGTLTIGGATTVSGAVNMNSGNITLGANLTVGGTFTMPQGTFTFGSYTLDLKGDFNRTGGTIGATEAGTGTLSFSGTKSQTFTPGTQMNVFNVIVNNTGPFVSGVIEDDKVTMTASLIVLRDFTITSGRVILGTSNIRMQQANLGTPAKSARFTNGGRGYTATGVGGIIFEGDGTNAAGAGDGAVMAGAQPYSNVFVRLSTATNNVYCLGAVKISGVVTLDGGGIIWNAADDVTDNFTASTLTLDDQLVVPTVVINTQNGHGSPFLVDGADGGAVALSITSVYNLSYTGQTDATVGATDFVSTKVNNLSIIAGTTGKTITFLGSAGTIVGALRVDNGETFNLNAQTLTASGNTAAHVVNGTVSNGTLLITGTGASLTGGSGTGNASSVATLTVAPSSGGTFTSTGMKVLTNLTLNQSALVSTITMNSETATIGTFTNTAGTTTLNMNSTASAITGNFLVTAGAVTLTMNGAAAGTRTIAGTLTINGGSLTLGSHIDVTGAVSQAGSGSLILGDYNLTLADNYTHSGTGTISAGTGQVIAAISAAATTRNYTFTTAVNIPNFTLNATGAGSGIAFVTNGLEVTNRFVHTAGDLNLGTLPLTISGSYTFTAGTYTSGGATGAVIFTGTAGTIDGTGSPSIPYVTVNTTGTLTFNPDNTTSTPAARTLTVSAGFTHTKGTIALGINDIIVTGGAYTFTAGTITATTSSSVTSTNTNIGEVVFNGGNLTPNTGSALSIPNVRFEAATTVTGTVAFTVANRLTFGKGNVTLNAAGRMTLSDGAMIVRVENAGTLSHAPAFAGVVDVVYFNSALPATITTGVELPTSATALRNLTVNVTGGSATVALNANITVNGTLFLTAGTLDISTNSKVVNLAVGATVSRVGGGSVNAAVTPAGAYNLTYTGDANITTSNNEWPQTASITTLTVSVGATTPDTVKLHASRTVANFTLNCATSSSAIDLNGLTLTVTGLTTLTKGTVITGVAGGTLATQGDVNAAGGTFGAGVSMSFTGSANQTITVPSAGATVGSLTINKASSSNTVTIAGGNLTCTGTVTFVNGLLVTGSNTLTLSQGTTLLASGFDRTGVTGTNVSHVVGNVAKVVPNAANIPMEFPVGTNTKYRPVTFTFSTAPVGVTITVSHVDARPTGTAGLPITDGIESGVDIARYPSFYWNIKSNVNIPPTYPYALAMTAEGFTAPTDYDNVANLRLIRRIGGPNDVNNTWTKQGVQYDNYEAGGVPTVQAINLTGAVTTSSAIFTYGLKSNMVIANPFTIPTLTDAAPTFRRYLRNPALVTGNTGALSFTASIDNPAIATVSISNDTLIVTRKVSGTTTVRVTATDAADGSRITYSTSLTVVTKVETIAGAMPTEFALEQNFPNPFNPSTMIRFALPKEAPVTLVIYNMLGVPVRTLINGEQLGAANHQVTWDGKDDAGMTVPSGMYLYRISAGSFQAAKKMTLLK